jgi:hypothetical protein
LTYIKNFLTYYHIESCRIVISTYLVNPYLNIFELYELEYEFLHFQYHLSLVNVEV